MPDWSIKIVTGNDGKEKFTPATLQAEQDDLVSWNNTTKQTHQPWPTDSNYNPLPPSQVMPDGKPGPLYMSNPIPPGESSRPSYDVAQPSVPKGQTPPNQWTVYYYCRKHPGEETERGKINAKVIPVANIPD